MLHRGTLLRRRNTRRRSGLSPHTRCSTPSSLLKRVEQELLGYFGSSAIYDGLPVLNSTTSHQVNCIHQSRAVMDAMLYPHVPMPETVVASNSNCNILWKPSKLGAALRHPPHEPLKEILAFRWLSERCRTAVDASKGFGREEANLDVFSRDIAELWESTSNSWRSESTTSSTRSAPDRVVFLVFYSHSQHTRAVGKHFISIKDRVVSYLSSPEDQEHGRGPRIVRVVPIIVGIKTPPQILSACLTSSPNELWYRRAGQYTTCSILQCLRELPLVCVGSGDAMSVLQRRVLLVSESWLFARTMAGLTNGPFLSRMEDMRSEVVPGVVSQSLSEAEVEAFARYVAVRAKSCD